MAMSDPARAVPNPSLPVFRTIEEGLAALRPAWSSVIKLFLVVLMLEVALDLIPALALGMPSRILIGQAPAPVQQPGEMPLHLLRALVSILLYINLLLAAARLVLFRETPTIAGLFRWGRRQWRLLGTLVIIGVAAAAPGFVGAFLTPVLGAFLASPAAVLAFLAIYVACWLWAAGWLLFVVPIVAADDPAPVLDRAWRLSAGNRSRLMGIPAAIAFALLILIGGTQLFASFFNLEPLPLGIPTYPLAILTLQAVYVVYAAAGAVAYRRLTGMMPEGA
jgi:hypothetical protein